MTDKRTRMGGNPLRRAYERSPAPKKPTPEITAPVSEVKRLKAKGLTIEKIGALLRCPYREVARALES